MDFALNEMQQVTRKVVKEFAEKNIEPVSMDTDHKAAYPKETLGKLAGMGLLGLLAPQQHGGGGLDTLTYTIIIEGIARACGSTAATLESINSKGIYPNWTLTRCSHQTMSML